ncbi:DUF2141 domain-containing protein [Ferrimonas futtsuensis]|uniref:DUF2141 domain-containing protein n=1 Tax=Ferrimonas futtsuensis TaxID=364764 RepID=UPI0004297921|nr:DUF2141 domain-containing protein [Ferrimonas futtsuensis]
MTNQALGLTLFTLLLSLPAKSADLTISVESIRNQQGALLLALFDNPKAYDSLDEHSAVASLALRPMAGGNTVTLRDLPPGEYVITALHDENRNEQLDTNKRGFPVEGYGYSRNAGALKTPKFSEAVFSLTPGNATQSIKLIYIK